MPTATPAPVAVALGVPTPTVTAPTTHRVAARALYVFYNSGPGGDAGGAGSHDADDVDGRALFVYFNTAVASTNGEPQDATEVDARALYAFFNTDGTRDPDDVATRALYTYGAWDDTELFPWIEKIVPNEQLAGGQIAIHGDGFGPTEGAEGGIVRLGTPPDPTAPGPGTALGVVSWQTRSPGLHPANSGTPSSPAIVATLPAEAESGMISVEETT